MLFPLLLTDVGCKTVVQSTYSTGKPPVFPPNSSAYVTTPKDGQEKGEKEPYLNSGKLTSMALAAALEPHVQKVILGAFHSSAKEAIQAAKESGCTYLVVPEILTIEDEPTEWSGVKDQIEISIKIIEASSENVFHFGTVRAKSKWLTFGGDHPEDMLKPSFDQYFEPPKK